MKQVTLWDLLGEAPVEMKKPAPTVVMPLVPASPEPGFPAFTAEDLAAIEHLGKALAPGFGPAHDSLWSAYICKGAVHTAIHVPLPALWRDLGCTATVRITRTRIGYTAGFWLKGDGYGRGRGGFHHPNMDLAGPYLWRNRQSALDDGASWLADACQEKSLGRHIVDYFAARGVDAIDGPPSQFKLRLISTQKINALAKRGPSAEDLALVDPGPSPEMLAFERAIGVTEEGPAPPGLAPMRT